MTIDDARGVARDMDRIGALAVQLTAALEHELPEAPDGSQVRLVLDRPIEGNDPVARPGRVRCKQSLQSCHQRFTCCFPPG